MISLHADPVTQTQDASDPNPKLRQRVVEFEGILLSQILEKLQSAYQLPGAEEADSTGESFQSFANSVLGKNLAEHDGLGLTRLLVQSLTGNAKGTAQ